MRSIALLAALFGLALLTGLTLFYGLGAVMAAVASSRWATALVVAVRAAALAGAGIGWWALVSARQPGPSSFVVLRFIREAIKLILSSVSDRRRCNRGKTVLIANESLELRATFAVSLTCTGPYSCASVVGPQRAV